MDFDKLNYDIYYLIYSKLTDWDVRLYNKGTSSINLCFFQINKNCHNMMEQFLTQYYITEMGYQKYPLISKTKNPVPFILLKYYNPDSKTTLENKTIKYIMEFIANKKRTSTIYFCKNAYHRMLAHKLCESHNLSHETIEIEKSKDHISKLTECQKCGSKNLWINKNVSYNDDYYNSHYSENHGYYVMCGDKSCHNYNTRKIDNIYHHYKGIQISKK
jgi:hypothetical protein